MSYMFSPPRVRAKISALTLMEVDFCLALFKNFRGSRTFRRRVLLTVVGTKLKVLSDPGGLFPHTEAFPILTSHARSDF